MATNTNTTRKRAKSGTGKMSPQERGRLGAEARYGNKSSQASSGGSGGVGMTLKPQHFRQFSADLEKLNTRWANICLAVDPGNTGGTTTRAASGTTGAKRGRKPKAQAA